MRMSCAPRNQRRKAQRSGGFCGGPGSSEHRSRASFDEIGAHEARELERLFDAFYTTRTHGTGIGLAVVKRIVEAHGFSLEVESEAGKGATFRVRVPPKSVRASPQEAPEADEAPPDRPSEPTTAGA